MVAVARRSSFSFGFGVSIDSADGDWNPKIRCVYDEGPEEQEIQQKEDQVQDQQQHLYYN